MPSAAQHRQHVFIEAAASVTGLVITWYAATSGQQSVAAVACGILLCQMLSSPLHPAPGAPADPHQTRAVCRPMRPCKLFAAISRHSRLYCLQTRPPAVTGRTRSMQISTSNIPRRVTIKPGGDSSTRLICAAAHTD